MRLVAGRCLGMVSDTFGGVLRAVVVEVQRWVGWRHSAFWQ